MKLLHNILASSLVLSSIYAQEDTTEAPKTKEGLNARLCDGQICPKQCDIYTRAAAVGLRQVIEIADTFDTFGDNREIVLMEDMDDEDGKLRVWQATVCNDLCDKSPEEPNPHCKAFAMALEMEELGKMSLFKSILKKKMGSYVRPVLGVAKTVVAKALDKTQELTDDDIEKLNSEIEVLIKKYMTVDKITDGAQVLLDKFNVPMSIKKLLKEDPKQLMEAGKNLWTVAKQKFGNMNGKDGKANLDISSMLPKAQELLGKLFTGPKDGGMDGTDEIDFEGDEDDYEDYDMEDDFEDDQPSHMEL